MEVAITTAGVDVPDRTEDGFAEFFAASWARLFRTAYALTGDRQQAEDALQSAFAKAYASWRRVRTAEHPQAYVRRMVVNEVLGVRRRRAWRSESLVASPPPPIGPTDDSGAIDRRPDRQTVWAAVSALPPRQRAVIVLRYYEDLSEAEIADLLGCRPGTVKSQASAALANLRARAPELDPTRTEDPR